MTKALITGIGITTAIGQGKDSFVESLLAGKDSFGIMQRQGRQKAGLSFIGAEISNFTSSKRLDERLSRRLSFCSQLTVATLEEAWDEARLDEVAPEKIALVIGGSNLQQRELVNTTEAYTNNPLYVKPSYSISLWDTDLCGLCTEVFPIRGVAYSIGGASASGQVAVMHAVDVVESGRFDVCIAIGAMTDISYLECQALRNVGAMGSTRYAEEPPLACRPFDQHRDGFIYGEACGVVIVESIRSATSRKAKPYGKVLGTATVLAGNRNPNPDLESEIAVIDKVLDQSKLSSKNIDYVNPHGSGSIVGDTTEINAILSSDLSNAFINTTKSITGHGLSAAGAVEIIATLLQMRTGQLHPSRNLITPEVNSINWVSQQCVSHKVEIALCLSYGFSGINTALCLENGLQ
ncbi:MAG: polyketide beta-ketoacyl:ACP synthase [Blastocatellia bacterium]|nr:polyketide beta-ketoacyl:ACP synthase [Blastocatellia bacterium]